MKNTNALSIVTENRKLQYNKRYDTDLGKNKVLMGLFKDLVFKMMKVYPMTLNNTLLLSA